jgi:hypothetical protein
MIAEMKEMMKERLQLWNKKNNARWPQKIIVYRDGVSEGTCGLLRGSEEKLIKNQANFIKCSIRSYHRSARLAKS